MRIKPLPKTSHEEKGKDLKHVKYFYTLTFTVRLYVISSKIKFKSRTLQKVI